MTKHIVDSELLERIQYLLDTYVTQINPEEDELRAILAQPAADGGGLEVVAWQDAENPLYTTGEKRQKHGWATDGYPIVELIRKSDADVRDAMRLERIAELEAQLNDPDYPPKYSRRLIAELRTKWRTEHDTANAHIMAHDALRTELAALKAQEPVAWQQRYIDPDVGASAWGHADARTASILKGRSDYELRPLYAAPAKQEMVMPPCPYRPELREEMLTDYEKGELQGRCDMWEEVKRLNGGKP